MDAFNSDAFGTASLCAAIQLAPYKPKMIGGMGLFSEKGINTNVAFIEKKGKKLSLLPTANRGTVNTVRSTTPRTAIPFNVPHVPHFQSILADDVYGIRAFGSESELQAVASHVNEQLIGMKENHEVTWEYHRIGALKGEVLDADGTTVIYNFFTEFDLTQTVIPWYSTDADYSETATTIIRTLADALGNDNPTGIVALCGNDYFDAVTRHDSIKSAYDRWRDGEYLRMSHLGPAWFSAATNGFMYQNIMFVNYRGQIDDITFIPDDEAYFFPSGIPGLFIDIMAPADFMETVNTKGKRIYAKQERMKFDKGVELHTQSNVLSMCTQPNVIIKSTWAATAPASSSSSA